MISKFSVAVSGQGLYEITNQAAQQLQISGEREGLCTLFIRHTSASLLIQENADPSARRDLEQWMNRLVPEGDRLYTHTMEGADDMPGHIKSMLTATSVSIPFENGAMVLGGWQGIFLWEHRHHVSSRQVILHIGQ